MPGTFGGLIGMRMFYRKHAFVRVLHMFVILYKALPSDALSGGVDSLLQHPAHEDTCPPECRRSCIPTVCCCYVVETAIGTRVSLVVHTI